MRPSPEMTVPFPDASKVDDVRTWRRIAAGRTRNSFRLAASGVKVTDGDGRGRGAAVPSPRTREDETGPTPRLALVRSPSRRELPNESSVDRTADVAQRWLR